jgi:hypothetical protein
VDQRGRYSNLPSSKLLAVFLRPEWCNQVHDLYKQLIGASTRVRLAAEGTSEAEPAPPLAESRTPQLGGSGPAPAGGSCVWVSAKGAVDDDLVQGAIEEVELLIIELGDEQLRDPARVDRDGFG